MRVTDLVQWSLKTVVTHKLRSGLTALGIIIGIASAIILTSIGEGVHRFVLAEFTQFGTNLVAVMPGKTTTFGISGATISTVRPLSMADANALAKLDNIIAAVPLVQGNARIEAGNKQRRASVFGVGAAVPVVWHIKVHSGRFLPEGEHRNPRPFAVLGSKLKDELFPHESPLGKRVRIGSDRFMVIGVMEEKGQMLGFDLDDSIYIPAAKALQLFDRESLMEIDLLYAGQVSADKVSASISRLLISRHGREDFTLITQKQMLETLDSVLSILTLAVAALGGISLLVGSVGIVTIMTIAVAERISEIGLLRAIGAEQKTIFFLFMGEALVLAAVGGIIGILFGIMITQMISILLPDLPVYLAWKYIVVAFCVAILIGLIAGILPAMKAARLSPLETLRSE